MMALTFLWGMYTSWEEEEIIAYMCCFMIVSMSAAFVALSLGITAPYGRYSADMSLGTQQSERDYVMCHVTAT